MIRSTLGARLVAGSLLGLGALCGTAQAQDDGSFFGLYSMKDSPWLGRLGEPVTMPYWFESPLIHTSVRPVFAHHRFPTAVNGVPLGGELNVMALQARIALTDRLAIIATKDGYFDYELEGGAGLAEDGWSDIAGGVKYAVLNDVDNGRIVTVGLIGEFTQGSAAAGHGNGDGQLRPFVASGFDFGRFDLVATFGANLPFDDDAESTSLDWHINASYELTEQWRPFAELNGIRYVSDGQSNLGLGPNTPLGFEGVDVINIGASNVTGNDIITGALGMRWALNDTVTFGAAYEIPVFTSRDDLYEDRFTLDAIIYL